MKKLNKEKKRKKQHGDREAGKNAKTLICKKVAEDELPSTEKLKWCQVEQNRQKRRSKSKKKKTCNYSYDFPSVRRKKCKKKNKKQKQKTNAKKTFNRFN